MGAAFDTDVVIVGAGPIGLATAWDSPLSRDRFGRLDGLFAHATRPGDRVPDAGLVLNDGRETTLFDLIYNADGHSWGWRLLLLDGGDRANHPSLTAAAGALDGHSWMRPLLVIADPASTGDEPLMPAAWDLDQTAHTALGLGDTAAILLVRPDGHLSFRGGADDLSALIEHVATFAAPSTSNTWQTPSPQ